MSTAYEEWVRVERTRLALLSYSKQNPDMPIFKEAFDHLTKENKKRRLLFAKGRKEPINGRRKIR